MKKENFSLTKTTVECYKIRHTSGMYWADITIDSRGKTGRIQIASDYGDYQYYWGACGCEFKEFLQQIGIDYAASKFGADRWYDYEATVRQFKTDVIEYRRHDTIDSKKARALWDEIKTLEDVTTLEGLHFEMGQCDKLMGFYNHCPHVCYDITPQFKKFWANVWPVFLDQLKSELKEPVAA